MEDAISIVSIPEVPTNVCVKLASNYHPTKCFAQVIIYGIFYPNVSEIDFFNFIPRFLLDQNNFPGLFLREVI